MHEALQKALNGKRITDADALDILKNAPWTDVVQVGNAIRERLLPERKVGYTAYRIVNYTNVCTVRCSFCSFCRYPHDKDSYVYTLDEMCEKTREAKALGANQIFLQGGVHPGIKLDYYTSTLKMLTQEEGVTVRGFSPVELVRMAETYKMPLEELIDTLKDAGLSSVPGAGAEILSDSMREKLSPRKLTADEWCNTMALCQKHGLPGSANIVFGSDETPEQIIEHLSRIRNVQDETNGFKSFVAWTFQPQTDKFYVRHVRGDEYLKLLALSRIFFDNIPHIEVSLLGMGLQLGELGLHAGADDINSIVIEENVLQSHGLTTVAAAEQFIRDAGFTPYRRTLNFD